MCGRFAQPRSAEELARIYAARALAELPGGRFNVAPTDEVAAVVERHGERQVDVFRWGLVPSYAESLRSAARHINARAETVEHSAAYRTAFARRRCVIPADAFYEWRRRPDPSPGRRPTRTDPYAFRRRDGEPISLAGIWSVWRDPETLERILTCSILTTAANDVVEPVHARMPVVLEAAAWPLWIREDAASEMLRSLLLPAPPGSLEGFPVSAAVNDVRRNGPDLLAPISPPPLATTLGL